MNRSKEHYRLALENFRRSTGLLMDAGCLWHLAGDDKDMERLALERHRLGSALSTRAYWHLSRSYD